MAVSAKDLTPLTHHQQQEVCLSRARYRQGRKDTAVKVYTIHQESTYILIQGVPSIGLQDELESKLGTFGEIVPGSLKPAYEYPGEQFTLAYLVKFSKLKSAKDAKRKLDDLSFYGSPLHVCYAPEHETIEETKNKLKARQNYVQRVINSGNSGKHFSRFQKTIEKPPAMDERVIQTPPLAEVQVPEAPKTFIWAGKEYTYSANETAEDVKPETENPNSKKSFLPRQLSMKHKLDSSEYRSSDIAAKLKKVATPNPDVSLKRKKCNVIHNAIL